MKYMYRKVPKLDGSGTEYAALVDVEGIVAAIRFKEWAGELNERGRQICAWLDELGRYPTAAEFRAYLESTGTKFVDVPIIEDDDDFDSQYNEIDPPGSM